MIFNKIIWITVVVRQASIGRREPGICKGCPSIAHCHMKLDRVVGADLSRTPPIYRPSARFALSLLICEKSLSAFGGFHDTSLILLIFIISRNIRNGIFTNDE